MATYLVLNMVVIALVTGCAVGTRFIAGKPVLFAAAVLSLLTLIFDNLIIYFGIVAYDPSRISGLMLWLAPIEDFAYGLVAVILAPLIWQLTKGKR